MRAIYNQTQWLPHLKDSIPKRAMQNRMSLYTIALEAWRRGLEVSFFTETSAKNNLEVFFEIKNQNKSHVFKESNGDKNTSKAIEICSNKQETNKYLRAAGIKTPKEVMFNIDDTFYDIKEKARKINFPSVIKPIDGSGGEDVYTNIKDIEELIKLVEELKKIRSKRDYFIQEYIEGKEIRVYVLEDKVKSAIHRRPPYVIGNGKDTIRELIAEKNEARRESPHLYYRPIKLNKNVSNYIKKQQYHVDAILPSKELLYLSDVSNISIGGEPIDATKDLTQKQRDLCVRSVKSIPGLKHAGVDMLVNYTTGDSYILEINTSPGLGLHLYPLEGDSVDIPSMIIDYYFPETTEFKRVETFYFDLSSILNSLNSQLTSRVTLRPCPIEHKYVKKLIIETGAAIEDVYKSIKKNIHVSKINGYLKRKERYILELFINYQDESDFEELKLRLYSQNKKLMIKSIHEESANFPVKVGFDVERDVETLDFEDLFRLYQYKKRVFQQVKKENEQLKKRIRHIKDSVSWKVTKIIRLIKSN